MGFLSMLNPWKWGTIGLAIALVACGAWGARVNSLRSGWESKYTALNNQAQGVLIATQQAANNPDLKWPAVPAQITSLASSNIMLKSSIDTSNAKLEVLNADFLKQKASGETLRTQVSTAQAGRQSALDKLKAMSSVPGDRVSCSALLSQTQDALDLAYGSGL